MSLRRAGTQRGQAKAGGGGTGRESREEVALPNHPGPRAARENAIPVAKERSEGARAQFTPDRKEIPPVSAILGPVLIPYSVSASVPAHSGPPRYQGRPLSGMGSPGAKILQLRPG